MGNEQLQETSLLAWLADELRGRLGTGWSVELASPLGRPELRDSDAWITLAAPDGTTATLGVRAATRATPSSIPQAPRAESEQGANRARPSRTILVAPYIAPRVREECRRRGIAYADQTGAWSLTLATPSIDWQLAGATTNPNPEGRGLTSLGGRSTARVLRILIDSRPPFTLRELAGRAQVTIATVYKVLVLLEGEGLVEREPRGAVVTVDWRGLLLRWARDYALEKQNAVRRCLAPRGVEPSLTGLRALAGSDIRSGLSWAITGAWAARREFDALAGARLALYTNQPMRIEKLLDLRPMEGPGSNVLVVIPRDERLFEESVRRDGLWYAPWSQVAVDLLGGKDREPSAGENLLAWMEVNEARWRGARAVEDPDAP